MTAEPAASYEALQAQANAITELFMAAGYELIAPAYLQPADMFLDRMGEAIRARTYVFTDNDGEELCLRPDVTLPACRVYLERYPLADANARFCYNGPAFRYQPGGGDAARPREFRQAGIEHIGGTDAAAIESEVTGLVIDAIATAGLKDFKVRVGDLGLFDALIEALDMPERWRARLRHAFWRPTVFRGLLKQLSTSPAGNLGAKEVGLFALLDPSNGAASEARVAEYLDSSNIPLEGVRSLSEITQRLLDRATDAKEPALPQSTVDLVEAYLAVAGPVWTSLETIAAMTEEAGVDIASALDAARARYETFETNRIDLSKFVFEAEFGRDLQYYTGHVFQVEIPGKDRSGQIAGGGRYDDLIESLGAPQPVPAVGSAIHTERLLAAVTGGAK